MDDAALREPLDRQEHPRRSILVSGRLLAGDTAIPCQVVNISDGGVRVRLDEPVDPPSPAVLKVDGKASIGVELTWRRDELAGFRYTAGPNAIEGFVGKIEDAQPSVMEQRRHVRCSVLWSACVYSQGRTVDAIVLNLSAGGAKLRLDQPAELDDRVTVSILRFGDFHGRVAWRNELEIGVQFLDPPERVAEILGEALPRIREDVEKSTE